MNIAAMLDRNVEKFGEYNQLIFMGDEGERILKNSEILKNARALCRGLKRLGVRKGDRVAVMVSNIPQIPELMNGVLRSGAVFLPVIYMLTPPEIRYVLEDSGARVVITEEKLLPKIVEAGQGAQRVPKIVVIGEPGNEQHLSYDDLLQTDGDDGAVEDVADSDTAILMYTSGTTGTPKGVMLSHYNLDSSMKQGAEVWPSGREDKTLITVPMNHIYGVLFYNESCFYGGSTILFPWFKADKALDAMTRFRITIAPLVPTMIIMMMAKYDPNVHDVSSIKLMISSGAPLAEETLLKAQRMFNTKIYHGYGCTEGGPTIARQRMDRPLKLRSVGPPITGMRVKIVDDNDRELPQGEEGEIACQGPGIMKGYWNKPEETGVALRGGWLHSGDLGRLDEDGELYVTGRKKDLIIKGGENIDPGVSENVLLQNPAVLAVAVVGIPDEKYGEEVGAAVVLKENMTATEEALLGFAAERLHRFVTPKRIFFFDDLPKTANGKILKREIKRILAGQLTKGKN